MHPDATAAQLFDSLLTPAQRASWHAHGFIEARRSLLGRRYYLVADNPGGAVVRGWFYWGWLCIHASERYAHLPAYDHWISLLLFLRAKPGRVWRKAGHWRAPGHYRYAIQKATQRHG